MADTDTPGAHAGEAWAAQHLPRLFDLSLDLWAIADFAGVIKQVNPACTKVLGWSREQLLGRNWSEFIYAGDLEAARAGFGRVVQGEVGRNVERRILCRDGSFRWILWNTQPLLDERLIVAVGRDITQTHRDDRLLQRTNAAARIGGWELDCLTGELYWTGETYRLHDTSPAAYVPHVDTAIAFYAPESRPLIAEAMRRGVMHGDPFDLELDLISARGRRITVRAVGEAERQDGRTTKLFGSLQDITERTKAQDEKDRLEARVLHAQKLDSLGVLAGGVAHDFNNLLTGILGHADLARMRLPPGSPALTDLDQVVLGATRAADLTRQLLAYSGKGKFIVQPLNLSALLREMGHLLQVSISKKAKLKYHLAADLPPIEADSTQLRQVAMNLIINANEALGDRPGLIVVSTGTMHCDKGYFAQGAADQELPEGPYVFLGVADTGCGMSEEVRAKIFDPFFSTKFAGRGLGLAAVLGIVRGHKGAIRVLSEPGRGTTFKVLFPTSAEPTATVEPPPNPEPDWQGHGLVLVVDDEAGVREMARSMLRKLGFSVLTAHDGRDGVETFRRHADEVRLVLLDVTMPELDGEAAFEEMKAIRPDVRVVLSSGYSQPEGISRLAEQGLAGFIQKPYRYDHLAQTVRQALDTETSGD